MQKCFKAQLSNNSVVKMLLVQFFYLSETVSPITLLIIQLTKGNSQPTIRFKKDIFPIPSGMKSSCFIMNYIVNYTAKINELIISNIFIVFFCCCCISTEEIV